MADGDLSTLKRLPIRKYATPVLSEGFFTEQVDWTAPGYAAIKRGTKYSSLKGCRQEIVSAFTELYFLREIRDPNSTWATRLWATDTKAEDSYNSAVEYIANAVNYPSFTRTYTVRRDNYDANPTLAIGSTLTGLVGVRITAGGTGYTAATGTIGNATVDFVIDQDTGAIIAGIVTLVGSSITNGASITITGDGSGATATAIVQPASAVLTSQKKTELEDDNPLHHEYVLVTRVYETLPGPFIGSTEFDEDGKIITTQKRRNIAANITTEETLNAGVWSNTTKKGDDAFVAEEVVESREIPGNPIKETKVAEDGIEIDVIKTMKELSSITTEENITTGVWTKKYIEPIIRWQRIHISDLVAWEVVETRAVPGNAMTDTKIDKYGNTVSVVKTLKDTSTVSTSEVINGSQLWIRTYKEPVSDLVCWETVESLQLPGNALPDSRIDENGNTLSVARTLKDKTTITPSEDVNGSNVWIKTFAAPISDLVSEEVVEAMQLPGVFVPFVEVSGDLELVAGTAFYRKTGDIIPERTEGGGVIHTVEKKRVTDSVSEQIIRNRTWLDKATFEVEIPNIIPADLRAQIPTVTESHIRAGTASQPSLGPQEFRHMQQQLDALLYEDRVVKIATSLPITVFGQETTEEYGGGILQTQLTLAANPPGQTVDEGLYIVDSKVTPLGNAMDMKFTRFSAGTSWIELNGVEVDPRTGIVINIKKKVVPVGTTGGVDLGGDGYIDIKPLDKWRSIRIASKLDPSSLPGTVQWETTVEHSFPNTLVAVTWLWDAASDGDCCFAFDTALETEIDQGYAGPCRARITESFTNGPPPDTVAITQFFPKAHEVGFVWGFGSSDCGSCRASARTWGIPPTLHDAITIGGGVTLSHGSFTSTLPATTPIGLPSPGTLITKAVDVERWRFGVFFRRMTEIYVPG